MSELDKAAEILVECGYTPRYSTIEGTAWVVIYKGDWRVLDFKEDTLEGRRQADAIEDWLFSLTKYHSNYKGTQLWEASKKYALGEGRGNRHQWRLDRIKWCLEQLDNEHPSSYANS